ncbi:MAG: 30S ribosomal protein S15 [Planctomycetes bacterium]|nr:30S ribosomal protein S15 [Planctomycetota bacterium]
MEMLMEDQASIIKKYRQHEKDRGSSEVQVALLTHRINQLTDHLAAHKKDHATRRGLMMLVGKRSKLLQYLERESPERYQKLIQSLKLRK